MALYFPHLLQQNFEQHTHTKQQTATTTTKKNKNKKKNSNNHVNLNYLVIYLIVSTKARTSHAKYGLILLKYSFHPGTLVSPLKPVLKSIDITTKYLNYLKNAYTCTFLYRKRNINLTLWFLHSK